MKWRGGGGMRGKGGIRGWRQQEQRGGGGGATMSPNFHPTLFATILHCWSPVVRGSF